MTDEAGPLDSSTLVDGGLAALALALVVAVGLWRGVGTDPAALGAGALGAVVLEALLARRREAVRRAWERPATKAAAVVALLSAVVLAVRFAPGAGLSLLAGGLVGYLALLAGATLGGALGGR